MNSISQDTLFDADDFTMSDAVCFREKIVSDFIAKHNAIMANCLKRGDSHFSVKIYEKDRDVLDAFASQLEKRNFDVKTTEMSTANGAILHHVSVKF